MKTKKLLTAIAIVSVGLIAGCQKDNFQETIGVCPIVVSTSPTDGAAGVRLDKIVTVTFNEKMDPTTITGSSITVQETVIKAATISGTEKAASLVTALVAGTITYSGVTATFTPTSPLTPKTNYTGRVRTTVKDLMGNALQVEYMWTFTTSSTPTVSMTDPANSATNVTLNKVVSATFSMPMDSLTLTATTVTLNQGTTAVAGTIAYSGSIVTFTPSSPLLPNTVYTGTITTGASNKAGIPLASNYVWTFNTGISPTVLSTDPANNATSVVLDKVVAATFSVPMDPTSLTTTTFTIKQGTTPLTGTVSYSGTTAFFMPTIAFAPNTIYTGTITTGAKNLLGAQLVNNYVWTFTTALTAPTVISTDPAINATNVVLNKVVAATFSVPMDPTTITTTSFTLKQGTNSITGAVAYSGSTATFTPTVALLPNTLYTGTITTAAKNVPGAALANDYVWSFTTGTFIAPTVISTDPANNAIGVNINKVVGATFSVPMDASTLTTATVTLKQGTTSVIGVVTYNGATSTTLFTPSVALLPNTVYTGTITTGAKNVFGTPLASDYVWTFTTTLIPPTVISTDPTNLETGVVLNKVVSATFSVPMDPTTITTTSFTLKQGTNSITGAVAYSGSTATFTSAVALLPNTLYTGTITTAAKNIPGATLASDYVWSFTTGTFIAPTVISTDPANNAIGVNINKVVGATFSVPMDPTSLTTTTFTIKQGTTPLTGTVSYSGTTAFFMPTIAFAPNTIYTGTITTGAKNVFGTSLASDYVWTFTTALTPPTVISTDPTNLETGVVLNKVVAATFSVPMDPTTITTTSFTLKQGTNSITGAVAYSGSTATFTPTVALTPNTLYTGTITTAAKNVPGAALASDYVWSFTTGTFPAPTVISTDPANNAIGVNINKVVGATFSVPMDASSLTTATVTLKHGTTSVTGVVTYNGTTSTTFFTPSVALLPNTVYTGTITTGAKNVLGTTLASDYVWTFTTALTPPTVISTDPTNLETGVVLNKVVSATFSVPMNPTTITGTTFTLKQGTNSVTGTVAYSGSTATFTPTVALTPNTVYTGTITTGVKNVPGTALVSNYVWTFTTGTFAAPTVVYTDPINGATGVGLNKVVAATFSVPMDATSLTTATFTMKKGATSVIGVISYSGSTAYFTPNVALAENTLYTCTITTGAKNVLGTTLANDYVWNFTTLQISVPPSILGSAANFGAFGGNAGITNQGINTVINNGGIGTTAAPTLVTGFHDGLTNVVYTETTLNEGLVTGGIFTGTPAPGTATSAEVARVGLLDANAAYLSISPASKPGGIDPGAGELGGLVLAPGIYKSASGTFNISNGDLTLDAQGDANAQWIFQTAAGLTVGIAGPTGARSIIMINGGKADNVYWYVGSAATINGAGGGTMVGNIIANSGVTFSTPGVNKLTTLNGRAISLIASVTMVNTIINVPSH